MRPLYAILIVLSTLWLPAAGCDFSPPQVDDGDDNTPDAGNSGTPDAPATGGSDAPPACAWTFDPVYFDPCDSQVPTARAPLTLDRLGTYIYDTTGQRLEDPDQNPIDVPQLLLSGNVQSIWLEGLTIESGAVLRVVGNRPLIIVSTGDITIDGEIDASSKQGGTDGPGANPSACPTSPPAPGETCAQHGGSGGGGGGFGGAGGQGGEGGDGRNCEAGVDGRPGGPGGVALAQTPTQLRGGCAGRDGAANNSGTAANAGDAGAGGGAVHLSAQGTLKVNGSVHAGGAGGGPGTDGQRAGGGGGGSGGMLGLEAGTLVIGSDGVVAANGGGGGGGCDGMTAMPGQDGQPSDQLAAGGPKQNNGGDGGDGGAAGTADGESPSPAERGGGGAGGGVGIIQFFSPSAPTIDGKVSPPAR